MLLEYRDGGARGLKTLLEKAWDYARIPSKVWYVPIVLLRPAVVVVAYGVMLGMGTALPSPELNVLPAVAMLLAFLIAASGEELGWSGYVLEPLQARWNALAAGLLIGLVGALWHIVPLVQAQRSASWIAWWCLAAVSSRVIVVWLYNGTRGSVFATILCHATSNLSWQLFPKNGSHYDPRVIGLLLALVAVAVTLLGGRRSLARQDRRSRSGRLLTQHTTKKTLRAPLRCRSDGTPRH